MTTTFQEFLIVPIVTFAAGYALWSLSSRALRRRALLTLVAALAPVAALGALRSRLEQRAASLAETGCGTCSKPAKIPALLIACAALAGSRLEAAQSPHVVTDDTGASLTLAAPAARIVSLSPGATELLFAAGAGAKIVATVQSADEPAAARKIERIGDANKLDYPRLRAAKPDVVVVWRDLTNALVLESLAKLKLPVYAVSVSEFGDFAATVRRLGVLAGTSKVAEAAAQQLARRATELEKRKFKGAPLRVFYMVWDSPLYTIGGRHLISEALAHCGARNIFDDIDFPSPIVEFKNVVSRDPELILMSTTPITARDWRERWTPFTTIRAVQTKQVITFEDTRLDRMGPTAFDALPGLCEKIAAARDAESAQNAQSRKFSN